MKFDCGESPESKTRKHNLRMLEEAKALRTEWRKKFAWWPVRVGENDCRWLETVEQRWPKAFVAASFLAPINVEQYALSWDDKTKTNKGDVVESRAIKP